MSAYETTLFNPTPATIEVKTITINGRIFTCPFADAMPPLKPEERAALREDIAQRGILVPIQVDEHDNVLDGHHRLEIAVELGLTDFPVKVVTGLSDAQKRDLAEDLNLHRRHLTREQIRQMLARRLKANPEQSDRAIADGVGVHHETAGAVRSELEGRGEIRHVATRTDRKGRKQPGRKRSRAKAKENKPPSDLSAPSAPPVQETAGSETAKSALLAEPSATTPSTAPVIVQTATPESPSAPTAAEPTEATPAPVPTAMKELASAPLSTSPTAAEPGTAQPPVAPTKLTKAESHHLLHELTQRVSRPIAEEIKRLFDAKAEDRDFRHLLKLFERGAQWCRPQCA